MLHCVIYNMLFTKYILLWFGVFFMIVYYDLSQICVSNYHFSNKTNTRDGKIIRNYTSVNAVEVRKKILFHNIVKNTSYEYNSLTNTTLVENELHIL